MGQRLEAATAYTFLGVGILMFVMIFGFFVYGIFIRDTDRDIIESARDGFACSDSSEGNPVVCADERQKLYICFARRGVRKVLCLEEGKSYGLTSEVLK